MSRRNALRSPLDLLIIRVSVYSVFEITIVFVWSSIVTFVFLALAFFLLQKLESFSLFEEASLFRGIGAMKRAMQMEELALTNA